MVGAGGMSVAEGVHGQPGQVHLGHVERSAGIEPGQQQQILDQGGHPTGFGFDAAHRVGDVR